MSVSPSNSWSFDWYRASVDKSEFPIFAAPQYDPFLACALRPETVAEFGVEGALIAEFGDRLELEPPRRGRHGYAVAYGILLDGQRAGLYQDGHLSGRAWLDFNGSFAPEGAAFLRKWFPRHRVTRADVAVNFDYPGAFDGLRRVLTRIAARSGKRVCPVGNVVDGRTVYFPAKRYANQPGFTRLYEYGKLHGADPALVRVEHQSMPVRSDKERAASFLPVDFACYTRLQSRLSAALDMECVVPAPKPKVVRADLAGRLDFIGRTYRRTFAEALDAFDGDVVQFGLALLRADSRYTREDAEHARSGPSSDGPGCSSLRRKALS